MDNHCKKWNDNDLKYIFDKIKNKESIENIAIELKRTPLAVNSQFYKIINTIINIAGIDIEYISNMVNIPSNVILEYFDKYSKNTINKNNIEDKKKNNKEENNIMEEEENNIIKEENNIIKENDIIKEEIKEEIKEDIILNKKQQQAYDKFIEGNNIFITGPGGTGKTITLKKIINYCKENNKKYGVTATTGSAALLINGKTIHSYLGIGIGEKTADELFKDVRYKYKNIMTKIRELEVLIIDEISMMNSELFDKISCFLCLCKKNTNQFGGIQIILTGDFCQLESITGDYCFNSYSWKKLNLEIIFLNKMIRQDNDIIFKKILEELRYGICSDETYNILCECKNTIFNDNIKPTILYSKNSDVEKINNTEYNKLIENNAKKYNYPLILPELKKNHEKIKKWIKSLDMKENIELCIGAQIVITVNINQNKGLVNGTRGIILKLAPDRIIIRKNDNMIETIEYYKYSYIEDSSIYFKYMPVKLAYALTIHKSQGMTLDSIIIDIGSNIFAAGQAYTALSRGTELKNIKIVSVVKNSFIINEKVINFYKKYDKLLQKL
jgi:ATP-dependent DNA helicase PIF1